MRNSLSIINWPLRASLAPTEPEAIRARHPQTPYQPHNGYKQEYRERKRIVYTIVGLASAVFSLAASITLYVLVGVEEKKGAWILRVWIVVSAGFTALLALVGVSFYCNRAKTKGEEDIGRRRGTELRALGRREIEHGSQFISYAPLVQETGSLVAVLQHDDKNKNKQQAAESAVTVFHRPGAKEIPQSSPSNTGDIISSPDRQAGRSVESPTYNSPPRSPSPAKLRDQPSFAGDAPYNISPPAGSPDTIASNKSHDAQIARRDSLKKLREATLRRKQALESLK